MFYFDKINNKKILKSDLIQNAFFTTRESVIKTKEIGIKDIAQKNLEEIKEFLDVKKLIHPNQRHTGNIDIADINKEIYEETDALILTDKNIGIYLNFADCTPLIFYDEEKNIGAISHAGWRGTVEMIGVKTVLRMQNDFGCNLKNIKAIIGPSICASCFEVGYDVYNKLYQTINMPKTDKEKAFADLKEINRIQLEQIGIEQIDVCPYCTSCNNDLFFSYRKEEGTTNRHSAILILK